MHPIQRKGLETGNDITVGWEIVENKGRRHGWNGKDGDMGKGYSGIWVDAWEEGIGWDVVRYMGKRYRVGYGCNHWKRYRVGCGWIHGKRYRVG